MIPRTLRLIPTLLINIPIIISIILILTIIIVVNILIVLNTNKENTIANSLSNYNNTTTARKAILFKIFINFYIFKGIILYFIIKFPNIFKLAKFYVFNYFNEIVILRIYLYIFAYPYRNIINYNNNLIIYPNRPILRFLSKNSNRI